MIGTLGQFVREIRDKLAGVGDPIPVDIGGASIDIGDLTISNEVEIKNDTGNPVPILPVGVTSTGNSTSVNLGAGATFTGTGIEASPTYGTVSVCIFSSHSSATNGLKFQASIDNTNWETTEEYTYLAGNGLQSYSFAPSGRYFRLTYTNGATETTKLAIFCVLRSGYTKSSSHRIGDAISAEKDAELVKAVLAAQKPNGTFADINATAGGNLRVSIEETEDALPTITGLSIPEHNKIELSYTGDDLTGVVYKVDTTPVATLTLAYTDGRLTSVVKS